MLPPRQGQRARHWSSAASASMRLWLKLWLWPIRSCSIPTLAGETFIPLTGHSGSAISLLLLYTSCTLLLPTTQLRGSWFNTMAVHPNHVGMIILANQPLSPNPTSPSTPWNGIRKPGRASPPSWLPPPLGKNAARERKSPLAEWLRDPLQAPGNPELDLLRGDLLPHLVHA